MSIAFESEEVQLQKLRERLRLMSDEELVKFGNMVRGLSEPRVGVTPDPWKAQLQEAGAEWRRRLQTCSDRLEKTYAFFFAGLISKISNVTILSLLSGIKNVIHMNLPSVSAS